MDRSVVVVYRKKIDKEIVNRLNQILEKCKRLTIYVYSDRGRPEYINDLYNIINNNIAKSLSVKGVGTVDDFLQKKGDLAVDEILVSRDANVGGE